MQLRTCLAGVALVASLAGLAACGGGSSSLADQVQDQCDRATLTLAKHHDYQGWMRPCLGEEDDPRVGAILAEDDEPYYDTSLVP